MSTRERCFILTDDLKTDVTGSDSASERRITAIQASLRCFALSLAGLVPVLGIPFCIAATVQFYKARRIAGRDWNPAGNYLKAARTIATVGILGTICFLAFTTAIVPAFLRDMSSCASGST